MSFKVCCCIISVSNLKTAWHKIVYQSLPRSINCQWKFNRLFNHTWREMITNPVNGTVLAVNATPVDKNLYSAFYVLNTVNDIDYTYGDDDQDTMIFSYTLLITSATLSHGGRYQCSNDNKFPTVTGCLDIFITGEYGSESGA